MTLKSRLVDLYFADTTPTRYWSIWLMLLAAVGVYMRSDDPADDMVLMFGLAPWWCWSGVLVVLAIYRILGLVPYAVTARTKILTPLFSMVIWAMFIAAAISAPQFGMSILFVVPALQDTWILSRSFFDRLKHD
jgi:hypothetical protein